jgi:hypothetical protein
VFFEREIMNKLARNERRKLTSAFINAISSGTILATLIVPFIGFGLGTVHPNTDILNIVGISGFGMVLAFVLHRIARDVLKGLEE